MLVIVGPSACGKTQIVQQLIKSYHMEKLVTYTSRSMRKGEIDGRDYNFISTEEFMDKIDKGFFIEYVKYNDNYYGTPCSALTQNKVVILEPTGLKHYLEKARELINIVYLRCSKEVLKIRMINRGDKLEDIEKRLINDAKSFTSEIEDLADFVIDTTPSNVYDDAKRIYEYYKRVTNEKK